MSSAVPVTPGGNVQINEDILHVPGFDAGRSSSLCITFRIRRYIDLSIFACGLTSSTEPQLDCVPRSVTRLSDTVEDAVFLPKHVQSCSSPSRTEAELVKMRLFS